MKSRSDDAIAAAQTRRDVLVRECQRLLIEVSRRPGCIKLLGLVKAHLEVLVEYKATRQRR